MSIGRRLRAEGYSDESTSLALQKVPDHISLAFGIIIFLELVPKGGRPKVLLQHRVTIPLVFPYESRYSPMAKP
jgi:hypothetical protein